MLQTISLEIQNAINEVTEAREFYYFSKFQCESSWNIYQIFIDKDPRWKNPNATDEQVEKYRTQCDEYLAWANIFELEFKEAWHRLDSAKAVLLALYDEVEA